MGTLNFTVTRFGRQSGDVLSTEVVTSDAFTTTTAAAFVEDGTGDIEVAPGAIFRCNASEPMWVNFGGAAATVGDGFYLHTNVDYVFECESAGKVSVIDVA